MKVFYPVVPIRNSQVSDYCDQNRPFLKHVEKAMDNVQRPWTHMTARVLCFRNKNVE
jgi:hypothetical protein